MNEIEVAWLSEINWPLIRSGFPLIKEIGLRRSDQSRGHVDVDASVEIKGNSIARARLSLPLGATLSDVRFQWDYEECLRFTEAISPEPAGLTLTIHASTTGVVLPVDILSPKQWDCGIRRSAGSMACVSRCRFSDQASTSTGRAAARQMSRAWTWT